MGKVQIHKRRETRDFEMRDNWLVPCSEAPCSWAPKSKVKGLVLCLLVLLAIGLSACKDASSETTSSNKAAMELYCKYADNANLTVAYLGDLSVNGKCIDALMLQADNEMDWEMLKPPTSIAQTVTILSWWASASKPIFWMMPSSTR